jgi:hypothetical protein
MIRKKPAPHLMRGGYRFSDKIMRQKSHDPEKVGAVFRPIMETTSTGARIRPRFGSRGQAWLRNS